MRRFVTFILIFLLLILAPFSHKQAANANGGTINIVCTVFPQYDWVLQILGSKAENMNMTLLLNNRIDLHNFQPSVDDIIKISTCDLFIYVGGESDKWVENVIKAATNKNMVVINLIKELGASAKIEEIIEGMQDENEHEDDDHEDELEAEYDEHVWLSLKNAITFCSVITNALSSLDADNAEVYQNNLNAYVEKLSALDSDYQAVVDAASVKTLLFGDRFPFRYLLDDYGLSYHAAFPGCSAETEASFETIIFLAKKMDELNLRNVMVTESTDESIAKTIINSTRDKNQQILALYSMQSVTANDVTTFISIMENNLNVLKEALR